MDFLIMKVKALLRSLLNAQAVVSYPPTQVSLTFLKDLGNRQTNILNANLNL